MLPTQVDQAYMQEALQLARQAAARGEVPVAALLVREGTILARAHNGVEATHQATEHAEMRVLRAASARLQEKYLWGATLYVTLEPCAMCAAAIAWAQVSRLVYAAQDPKKGYSRWHPPLLPAGLAVSSGSSAEESTHLLRSFFQQLRQQKRAAVREGKRATAQKCLP